MMLTLKRGNDQIITLPGLRVAATGVFLNTATVIAKLYDKEGNQVYQDTMVYVGSIPGNGTYAMSIAGATLMLPKSSLYSLEVRAVEAGQEFRAVYTVNLTD